MYKKGETLHYCEEILLSYSYLGEIIEWLLAFILSIRTAQNNTISFHIYSDLLVHYYSQLAKESPHISASSIRPRPQQEVLFFKAERLMKTEQF